MVFRGGDLRRHRSLEQTVRLEENLLVSNDCRIVFTRYPFYEHRLAQAIRAGIVWVNDYQRIDPVTPWGGFGLSGVGRENGLGIIHEYTATRNVWVSTDPQPMDSYDSVRDDARLN